MRRIKFVLIAALVAFVAVAGWQVGSYEVHNIQFQEELHDMASQLGTRIGFNAPRSDDDYRALVVGKAKEHGIDLKTQQVIVQRTENGDDTAKVFLAAITALR